MADAAVLTVDSVTADPGEQNVAVSLQLTTTAGENISGLQFDLVYDATSLTIGSTLIGSAAASAGKTLSVNPVSAGRLAVVIVGLNQTVIYSGEIMTIYVNVAASPSSNQLAVTTENTAISNIYGGVVTATVVAGGISVTQTPTPVPPTADFTATPLSGVAPFSVQFSDISVAGDSPIASWQWDFGDGTSSTIASPSHLYNQGGIYTVALTVTTAVGSDTATKSNYITVYSATDAPTADFTASPISGEAPLSVGFTDQSLPGAAPITSWQWSFGDGTSAAVANPTHIYTAAGTYTVSLTVANSVTSDTFTAANLIIVTDPQATAVAAFSASPTSGFAPLNVAFFNQSQPDPQYVTSYLWTFGDGFSSTEQNPVHTYATAGDYTVQLTVTTALAEDTLTKTHLIHVDVAGSGPVADFTADVQSGVAPLSVQFQDASQPGTSAITVWEWSFGDGETSVEQSPSHVYSAPGSYTVSLTVTSSDGSDMIQRGGYIDVLTGPVGPVAGFSGTPRTGDAPLTVQFADQSTAGSSAITGWTWDFGDGQTSTDQNPAHAYTQAGTYDVALTVATADGTDVDSMPGYITVTSGGTTPVGCAGGTPRVPRSGQAAGDLGVFLAAMVLLFLLSRRRRSVGTL